MRRSASPYLGLRQVVAAQTRLPEDLVGEFGITLALGDRPAGEVLARRVSEAAGIAVRLVGRAPAASGQSQAEEDEDAGREWLAGFTDAHSSEGGLWSGPLDELLDAWAEAEGYSWRYGAETETVEIVRSETRVFGINALVGDIQHQVSTQTSGSGGDTTTGGSQQSITASMSYAPWKEIAEQAEAAAGEEASVSVSEAAGTVTVSGLPRAVERVRTLLLHLNATILRPLTLSVHLYSVRVGRGSNLSLGLSGALPDVLGTTVEIGAGGIGIVRPSTADGTSLLATVNALRSIGTATRVLSVDIPGMHGMPVQFYDLLDEAYLEEISVTISDGVREVIVLAVLAGVALGGGLQSRVALLPQADPSLGWKDHVWDHYGEAFMQCFDRARNSDTGRASCQLEVRAR